MAVPKGKYVPVGRRGRGKKPISVGSRKKAISRRRATPKQKATSLLRSFSKSKASTELRGLIKTYKMEIGGSRKGSAKYKWIRKRLITAKATFWDGLIAFAKIKDASKVVIAELEARKKVDIRKL